MRRALHDHWNNKLCGKRLFAVPACPLFPETRNHRLRRAIALAGYMQRDLVDQHRWFTEEEYLEGLALAQLAPGPLAAQLAMYLGFVRGGWIGATAVGFTFSALIC